MKKTLRIISADWAQHAHRRALVQLIDEYMRGPSGTLYPMPQEVRQRIVRGLKRHPAARVYFAVKEGRQFVGCVTCFSVFSTFLGRNVINIHDVIVTEKYRRKGVGKQLLEYISKLAKEEGCCKMTLEVLIDNVGAMKLYEQCGFGFGKIQMYFMTKNL
jgi:ribosomal protein S18 acetylase RimI-like enzyme